MREEIEVECVECDGVGTVEDRKGIETVCGSCRGKGKTYETKKSNTKTITNKENEEV